MSEPVQNFRTAFHGFNREDVVRFLETATARHTAEVNQLRDEIARLEGDLSLLRMRSGDGASQEELEALQAENARLKAQVEELETQLTEPAATPIRDETNWKDEEIGRGADRFNLADFGAEFAYTADGGTLGELEYENFNAAAAKVVFHGRNIHPGSAKNQMVNSQLIAMEFQSLLPIHQRPEATEGYEGFALLTDMEGAVELSQLRYIIRDHDMAKFTRMKELFQEIAAFLNGKYGEGTVELTLKDSYYNMKEKILPVMHIIDRAKTAMERVGITPVTVPVRGGTDGARLSYEGLPCPNLCTGGENYHGRFEYIPVEDMELCTQMLVELLCL